MKKKTLYLGDQEFNKKMMKLYAWIMPIVFGGMTLLLLTQKCWISSLLFFLNFFIVFPPFQKYTHKWGIKGIVKFILCAMIIYFALYSTNLYL